MTKNKVKKKTKTEYQEYLNEIGKCLSRDNFIIGGKLRAWYKPYGYLLRKFDNIAFQVGYNEWKNNNV